MQDGWNWHISTSHPSLPSPGSIIKTLDDCNLFGVGLLLPIRLVAFKSSFESVSPSSSNDSLAIASSDSVSTVSDLSTLGILEDDLLSDDQRYPFVAGHGEIKSILSACQMIALANNVPFRRDALKKVIEDQFRRSKGLSLELLGGLCEMLGLFLS